MATTLWSLDRSLSALRIFGLVPFAITTLTRLLTSYAASRDLDIETRRHVTTDINKAMPILVTSSNSTMQSIDGTSDAGVRVIEKNTSCTVLEVELKSHLCPTIPNPDLRRH